MIRILPGFANLLSDLPVAYANEGCQWVERAIDPVISGLWNEMVEAVPVTCGGSPVSSIISRSSSYDAYIKLPQHVSADWFLKRESKLENEFQMEFDKLCDRIFRFLDYKLVIRNMRCQPCCMIENRSIVGLESRAIDCSGQVVLNIGSSMSRCYIQNDHNKESFCYDIDTMCGFWFSNATQASWASVDSEYSMLLRMS